MRMATMILLVVINNLRPVQSFSIARNIVKATSRPSSSLNLARGDVETFDYTIDCPPTDAEVLESIVKKHCATLDRFLQNRPIAAHTRTAFRVTQEIVESLQPQHAKGIILDSGCGTGRSTLLLGDMFPEHIVIGIDRSIARLQRNYVVRETASDEEPDKERNKDEADEDGAGSGDNIVIKSNDENVLLVRAELSDFWRCCLEAQWPIDRHYLLYPNPYPKKARIKSRWYAHPSFPVMLELGGTIVVRSNWETYLEEFGKSAEHAEGNYFQMGPKIRDPSTMAWTNFEKKYDDAGEQTYELILTPK